MPPTVWAIFISSSGGSTEAADCWLAILRDRPDTDLSPALISVKAALALHRAGRLSEFEQVRAELSSRFGDEKPSLGGVSAPPAELLRRLLSDEGSTDADQPKPASSAAQSGPDLTRPVEPAWQLRFAESVEAGMMPAELTQWESNSLSTAVPAVTIDGTNLYANYLGYVMALDLQSGKMLWRSGAFHHLEVQAMQPAAQMLDPARFAIVAAGDLVWCLARDIKDQNFFAPFQLICRRADNGEVAWKSADLPDYAPYDLVGQPLLADGKLFIAAKTQANPQMRQGLPQQFVLAVQPHDGKLLWKTEIGTFRQGGQMYFYRYSRDTAPQPRLVYRAGAVYIDTHVGVLARLDTDSGMLDWGYGYQTDAYQSQLSLLLLLPAPGAPNSQRSAAPGRRGVPGQGNPVRPPLRDGSQPDESPLGTPRSPRPRACLPLTIAPRISAAPS